MPRAHSGDNMQPLGYADAPGVLLRQLSEYKHSRPNNLPMARY